MPPPAVRKIISYAAFAARDTRHQAAVKANGSVTISRVLADACNLVGRSGKTFTESELLAEARSGQFVYEHQEASEQRVRVSGDTACVAASPAGQFAICGSAVFPPNPIANEKRSQPRSRR